MFNYFQYNGIASIDFGLSISSPPTIGAPQRDEEVLRIPGRDGVLRIDQGRYDSVPATYSVWFRCGVGDVERVSRGIKAWLLGGRGDYVLGDTYDKDYFRIGSFSGPFDIENVFDRAGRIATLSFTCYPHKYSYQGQNVLALNDQKTIFNPEMFESKPRIRIYGAGNAEVYLNNQTIQLRTIDEYVELDSEAQQAYKNGTNKNPDVSLSEFPILQPGMNVFDWTSNITGVEITPRWRTL